MSKEKKLKIAIFHNLPQGGAKRYLYEITRRLSEKYDIDEYKIDTASPYLDLSQIVQSSKSYHYRGGSGITSMVRSIVKLPKVHKQISDDVNLGQYDLVITNHDYFTKSPYLHRYLSVPCVYICHEPQREFYEKQSIHAPRFREKLVNILRYPIKYIDIINTKAACNLIANSKYSQKYLKKVYGLRSSMVYPGVDSKEFLSSDKKENFVLAIGSLSPIKGHDFIIKSLGKIEKQHRPSLTVVGRSNQYYKEKLVKISKINGVKLRTLSQVSDVQLKKMLSSSLAYVSGAYREPFGLCILEAMASQTPAIVVEGGGAGEQIKNGIDGFIVKRDEGEFADKLLIIIKNKKKIKQ